MMLCHIHSASDGVSVYTVLRLANVGAVLFVRQHRAVLLLGDAVVRLPVGAA